MLIPPICLPYLALFALVTLFLSSDIPFFAFLMESVFQMNIFLLIGALLLCCVIALAVSVVYFVVAVRKGWDALTLAKCAMILKITQIPTYAVIFVLGVLLLISIMTIPFAIGLWWFDCFTLFLSGIFMVAAIINAVRQGIFTSKEVRWFVILQFIFCADVVAAVVFYGKLKKKKGEENA